MHPDLGEVLWRGLATRIAVQATKIAVFPTKGETLLTEHLAHWPTPWARSLDPEFAHLAADQMLGTWGLKTRGPWRFRDDLVIPQSHARLRRL